MLLATVYRYIDNCLQDKMGEILASPACKKVLRQLQNLLEEADDGKDLNKIKTVIAQIENLKVVYIKNLFFQDSMTRSMREILKEKYPVLKQDQITDSKIANNLLTPTQLLLDDDRVILGSIHLYLMKYYGNTWTFSYPPNVLGEIHTPSIDFWLTTLKTAHKGNAIIDFGRNIRILNKLFSNVEEITAAISNLVDQTRGYDKKNKLKLIEWLINNGGQDNGRFFDLALKNSEFTAQKPGQGPDLGMARTIEMNWYVAENGRIRFRNNFYVNTLQNGTLETIYTFGDGVAKKADAYLSGLNDFKQLSPLLRVNSEMELTVAEGEVKPKLVKFEITSYTDYLKSPLNKVTKEKFIVEKTKNFFSRFIN